MLICPACSTKNLYGSTNCKQCGITLSEQKVLDEGISAKPPIVGTTSSLPNDAPNLVGDIPSQSATTQSNVVVDAFNAVINLNKIPSEGFKFVSFIFPIAFLMGYGSKDWGKKVAIAFLLPICVVSLVAYVNIGLAALVDFVSLIWIIYLSYLVCSRHSVLVNKDKPFAMGTAVVSQLIFTLVWSIAVAL
jgi:hypothetical protein